MSTGTLRNIVVLGAVVCFSVTVGAADSPRVSQRWAVLVGVDEYAYAQKLQYCGADQRALREQLVASGFPSDQVFLLHDKAEDPRFRPSKGNIERQLNLVLNLADADDLVVVGFSGHGVHLGGKSYLCPGDCTLDDSNSLISVDGVYDRLKECAAEFKLVLVDACRNDPRPGGARSMTATEGTRALARTLQELKLPEGVVLLNSCAPGEISWEDEEFGHGVFMHFVLDGLNGAADVSGDGSVSLNELQAYAGRRTKTYVANRHSVAQRPFFKGDLTTEALEYALLSVPAAASKLLSPDAALTALNKATAEGDFAVFWNGIPSSHQAELTKVKNELAAKMDAEIWNNFFLVSGKLVRVLRAKKQSALDSVLLNSLNPELKAAAAKHWDAVVAALDALVSSEIKTLDGFQRADIGKFLATTGTRTVPPLVKAAFPESDPTKRLVPIKYTVISQDGDRATMRVERPGTQPVEEQFVRIEGKWVAKAFVDEFDQKVADIRDGIGKLLFTPEQKTQALSTLGQLNLALDRLTAATDQASFDNEFAQLIVLVTPLLQQAQGAPTN